MSPHVQTLLRELQDLLRLHERMLDSAERRQKAMAGRQVDELERLMTDELAIAQAIQELERRRQITMLRIGAELGRQPRDMVGVTVEELASWLPEPTARTLLATRGRLQELLEQIRQKNQAMTMLAQRCLPWFEELLGVLLGATGGQNCYTSRGQSAAPSAGAMGVVDIQI